MTRKRRGRGEGSIFQRADRLWTGTISLGYGGDGKRCRRTVYGDTKQEVQEKLRRLQSEADTGTLVEAGRLTVGQFLDRYLEATAKEKVRPTTFARYEQLTRIHIKPILGGVRLAKLHSMHVEAFYSELKRKGATAWTRKMAGVLLTSALRHAVVKRKLIPFNPALDVEKARPEQKEMLFWNEVQTKQFLDAAKDNRLHALFALALGSGMRQGELLGLQWNDLDLEQGKVIVRRTLANLKGEFVLKEPKSKGSRRTLQLPGFVVEALKGHRQAMLKEGNISNPVFCTKTGNYINKSNLVTKSFKPIIVKANKAAIQKAEKAQAAGLNVEPAILPDVRFHDLRHSHATLLLQTGHSIRAVSQRLGHGSPEITLRVYAHVLPSDDAQLAAAVEKMLG